jgi:aryl-alcohol dehydrogenase-like predicted oxidoreductase
MTSPFRTRVQQLREHFVATAAAARRDDRPAAFAEPAGLPPFVLGTGSFAALPRRRWQRTPPAAKQLIDTAIAAGCPAVDTAAVYGGGIAERAIGAVRASSPERRSMMLMTKGGHPDHTGRSRLDRSALDADLAGSLRRLGVGTVDVFLLHRDDPQVAVGPIMETLHAMVQARKVRSVGASNWSHHRIEEANAYAARHGLTPFTVSSVHLGLAEAVEPPWPGTVSITGDRQADARRWYQEAGLPVLAWSPLSGGFLAGRDDIGPSQSRAYRTDENVARRERAVALAASRQLSPAQVGLAYTRSLGMVVHPIVFARSAERLRALFDAQRVSLSPSEVAWLELRTDVLPTTPGNR